MTKEEYRLLLDIYITAERGYEKVYEVLMGGEDQIPYCLNSDSGLFGKAMSLEKILKKYSRFSDIDTVIQIIQSEDMTLDQKVDALFKG